MSFVEKKNIIHQELVEHRFQPLKSDTTQCCVWATPEFGWGDAILCGYPAAYIAPRPKQPMCVFHATALLEAYKKHE